MWIVDDDQRFLKAAVRRAKAGRLADVQGIAEVREALCRLEEETPDLILVDIHLDVDGIDGIELVRRIRGAGYRGKAVMLSGDKSRDLLFRAGLAGADDYLVKHAGLDLAGEILRLLAGERSAVEQEKGFQAGGYLRSLGLNERQIALLLELCRDYPPLKALAVRLDKSEMAIRRDLSRIYKKLNVEHYGKLAHVMTILSMYGKTEK